MPAAIASAASTAHVRSWRPASTSTGAATSPSRSSTSMAPYSAAAKCRSTVGRVDAARDAALELLDARVERVGEVERELVVQQRGAVLLGLRLGLARPRPVTCSRSSTGSKAARLSWTAAR